MEEIWKDIWRDTNYAVSNFGRVKNKENNSILHPSKLSAGHLIVTLSKRKQYLVHRLVFEAFYRRLQPNEFCHHINQQKDCNLSTNLVAWDKSRHTHFHNEERPEETNARISEKIKNLWKDEKYRTTRKNNSNAMKELWKNEEWRAKLLQARRKAKNK